jgi:hypothetical protein
MRLSAVAVMVMAVLRGCSCAYSEWPGEQSVRVADRQDSFQENMSGLLHVSAQGTKRGVGGIRGGGKEDVIWSVQNKPSVLFQLMYSSTSTPSPSSSSSSSSSASSSSSSGVWEEVQRWSLHYGDGTGDPDAEDITKAELDSPNLYVCTEQDNEVKESRLSVLLFREDAGAKELSALQEWDLTDDLKTVDHNLGLEAITWVPDSYLVQGGLVDQSRGGALYDPEQYPGHGSGLFFVGLEGNGKVYAYALEHDPAYTSSRQAGGNSSLVSSSSISSTSSTSSYTHITTLSPDLGGIMSLHFDEHTTSSTSSSTGYLWTVCDNNCKGHSKVFTLSPDGNGEFQEAARFKRPGDMPNINNEGFSPTSDSLCDEASGLKPVFWCDDTTDEGHVFRQGTMQCGAFLDADI